MKTEYTFSVETGHLAFSRRVYCNTVYTVNHRDEMGVQQLCSMTVCEDETARRAFMNHFGDDSSWPPGWWDRIGRPQFTRLRTAPPSTLGFFTRKSWERENYPPSKVSWQEYFGVKSP